MTSDERIAALETALEDVLGMAEAHVMRLERSRGQKCTAQHARKITDIARALLADKPKEHPVLDIREAATRYAATILKTASDWQEAQHALADHDRFGPWLRESYPDAEDQECQSIIRDAERRLS